MVSQIKGGAILSYLSLGVNILTGLLFTPWMIHSIGRDNFGLYTLAMSVITLFVFDLGLSAAVTRFMSKYLAEGYPEKADNVLGLVYKLYIVIDFILLLILTTVYFFIPQIYESLTPEEIGKLKIVYIIAAVFSIISFPFIPLNGILGANEKFIQFKLCELINKLVIVVAMTICLLLGYGLYALVAVNAGAGIIMIVMKLFCVHRYTSTRVNFGYKNKPELKEILKFSGWTTVISLSQRMIFNLAPSILGIMSGSASIAILGVAITIEGYTYMFACALNGMFLPRVSRIMASDKEELLPLMVRIGRLQLIIIGAIVVVFVGIGHDFMLLWVGNDYNLSYYCAILLILPSVIHLPQEIASTAIVAANKVKKQAVVYVIMAICNIAMAFWFSKLWAALGVSLSICIAYFVRTIGMNYLYSRELKIDVFAFFKSAYTSMLIPMLIIVICAYLLNSFLFELSWVIFLLKFLIILIIAAFSYWFIGMNNTERKMMRSLVKR